MASSFVSRGFSLTKTSPLFLCRRSSSLSGLSPVRHTSSLDPISRSVLFGSVSGRPRTPLLCRGFSKGVAGDDEGFWNNAQNLLQENKIEDAVQELQRGLEEHKHSLLLISRLADIHMATGQYDKVVEVCDQALELGIGERDGFLALQGEAYDRLKNFDKAREKYEEVLQRNPNNALIAQRLAFLLLHATDWTEYPKYHKHKPVVAAFDRCLELARDDPENHYGRGLAFYHGEEFEQAIENFKEATDLDPKYAPAWQKMSLAHIVRKEFEQSIYAADRFFDTFKDYYSKLSVDLTFGIDAVLFGLMLKRALCYLMLKDYRMVIGSMESLLEAGKDIPTKVKTEALLLQSQAHFEEGGFWECVKFSSDCIKLDKESYSAYKLRSEAYEALGRTSSAEEDRTMCLRLAGRRIMPEEEEEQKE
uniref:Uncharacterized protein n=1 Tax=Paramoeba aestuarina TaxID=180227 RepID=A0A6U3AAF1_9EUKA